MSRAFSSKVAEVVRARRMVEAHMRAWGYLHEVETMTLLVSELVTNAVIHGQGPVHVTLTDTDGSVRVAVDDHGGGRPSLVQAGTEMHGGGWGLRLVDTLADEWGSVQDDGRTSVWVERRVKTRAGDGADREPS